AIVSKVGAEARAMIVPSRPGPGDPIMPGTSSPNKTRPRLTSEARPLLRRLTPAAPSARGGGAAGYGRTRSGPPLKAEGSRREVDFELVPPKEMGPHQDLRPGHEGRLRQNGSPVEGEVHEVQVLFQCLPRRQHGLDAADEPGVHGRTQGVR